MAKAKTADDGKTQHQRFVEAARKLGADESAGILRNIIRKVAKADTVTKAKKAAKKRSR